MQSFGAAHLCMQAPLPGMAMCPMSLTGLRSPGWSLTHWATAHAEASTSPSTRPIFHRLCSSLHGPTAPGSSSLILARYVQCTDALLPLAAHNV